MSVIDAIIAKKLCGGGSAPIPTKTGSLLRGDTDTAEWTEIDANGGYGWLDGEEINFTYEMYSNAEKITYINPDGGENVTAYVKVSDKVMTMEETQSVCYLSFTSGGETIVYDFTASPFDIVSQVGNTGISVYYGFVFSCSQNEDISSLLGLETPVIVPPGIWLQNDAISEPAIYPLKFAHGIKHLIEKSYLPDAEPITHINAANFTDLWSELQAGKTVNFIDPYYTAGGRIIGFFSDGNVTYIELVYDTDPFVRRKYVPDETGYVYCTRYAASQANMSSALYLKSSTANSTKQFKITVDDSGTISATEVT